MFAAAIALRYRMKDAPRPFRIGKGNLLMWVMGLTGFAGSLLAFVLSFIPPGQIQTGSNAVWYSVLVVGCIVMVVIPLVIYSKRKPSWKDPDTEFAPFHWEKDK
jgi:amino acid transporter